MKKITIRLNNEQAHKALVKSAESNHRTLNGEIEHALEFYLKNAPEAQYEVKPKKEVAKKSTPPQS